MKSPSCETSLRISARPQSPGESYTKPQSDGARNASGNSANYVRECDLRRNVVEVPFTKSRCAVDCIVGRASNGRARMQAPPRLPRRVRLHSTSCSSMTAVGSPAIWPTPFASFTSSDSPATALATSPQSIDSAIEQADTSVTSHVSPDATAWTAAPSATSQRAGRGSRHTSRPMNGNQSRRICLFWRTLRHFSSESASDSGVRGPILACAWLLCSFVRSNADPKTSTDLFCCFGKPSLARFPLS